MCYRSQTHHTCPSLTFIRVLMRVLRGRRLLCNKIKSNKHWMLTCANSSGSVVVSFSHASISCCCSKEVSGRERKRVWVVNLLRCLLAVYLHSILSVRHTSVQVLDLQIQLWCTLSTCTSITCGWHLQPVEAAYLLCNTSTSACSLSALLATWDEMISDGKKNAWDQKTFWFSGAQ